MNSLNISDRLKRVADCISKGNRVADIGCDHAYTAIYLIKKDIAKKVIALDINKGPLEKAKKNISLYGLDDYIETRLSDGGKELKDDEVDSILISGMGGRLTNKILSDSIDIVKNCKQLVLQPQSEIHLVREYIQEIGFSIIYEDMLIDDGKYYVIINAMNEYDVNKLAQVSNANDEKVLNKVKENKEDKKYKEIKESIEDKDIHSEELFNKYGKYLLENKNEILYKFLIKKKNKIEHILSQLRSNSVNELNNKDRIAELDRDLELIREGIRYYEV